MLDILSQNKNLVIEADRQRTQRNDNRMRNVDAETLEGYIVFGGGFQVQPELTPENDEQFFFSRKERFYQNADTQAQLIHLERYGYFYK